MPDEAPSPNGGARSGLHLGHHAATNRHAGCLALQRLRQRQVGMKSPFHRGSWPRFAFDDFSPPSHLSHTCLYLGAVSGARLAGGPPAQAPGPAPGAARRLGAILEPGFTKIDVRVGGESADSASCTTYWP
jgi:hypothetical protein